jgi:hypothetical protein
MLALLLANVGVIYFIVFWGYHYLPGLIVSVPSQYNRIPKAAIQKSLIIVSDMSSHFGRDAAMKLADMGFYVLGGVRTELDRKAFSGYNAIKGETEIMNGV